jgi:hypothetical protein
MDPERPAARVPAGMDRVRPSLHGTVEPTEADAARDLVAP